MEIYCLQEFDANDYLDRRVEFSYTHTHVQFPPFTNFRLHKIAIALAPRSVILFCEQTEAVVSA